MALVQQLAVPPALRVPGAVGLVDCSSRLSSSAHVGVGCDLQLPHILHCRTAATTTSLRRRAGQSHRVLRKKLAVADAVFTLEEDEETEGRSWKNRDSKFSEGRTLPSSSRGDQRGDWNSKRSESSSRGEQRGDGNSRRSESSSRGEQRGDWNSRRSESSSRGEQRGDWNSRRSESSSRGEQRGDWNSRRSESSSRGEQRGDWNSRRSESSSRGEQRGNWNSRRNEPSPRGERRGGQPVDWKSPRGDSNGGDRGGKGWDNKSTSQREYGGRGEFSKSNPRRAQGNNFNSRSSDRQDSYGGRNDRGDYEKNVSGGYDMRPSSQSKGKFSGRNGSKIPSTSSSTITPRQSTAEFVSERNVHLAPWEQGGSSRTVSERDFTQQNPLIERLQKMQREVEEDDEDDSDASGDEEENVDRVFEDDESSRFDGKGEKSAMARIVEKLGSIPGSRRIYESKNSSVEGHDSIFVPRYNQPMFPLVERGWSTPDHPVPTPSSPAPKKVRPDTRFPWEREDDNSNNEPPEKLTRVKPPSLAELTLPEDELKRLRSLGILTRHRIKVGKLGVTNSIVDSIHSEWRNSEVVRIKCEGAPAQNMKRTHETLEERTGGLVVWRAGGACLVYRGKDYVHPSLRGVLTGLEDATINAEVQSEEGSSVVVDNEAGETVDDFLLNKKTVEKIIVPRISSVYDPELEKEMEEILSSLGPRYNDWTGPNPVPVDADLLLGPDVQYKKPYRLLPYGVRPTLTNLEMTNLRRLGRPLPPHFILGMNRGLSGLAAAIVKLWERSEIAKIAVKRGVQNTSHERMGEELKRLTGGIILSRDKYFIVLYRGKDFLPPSVAAALEERQAMTNVLQEEEEKLRLVPQSKENSETIVEKGIAGTLSETLEAKANWERMQNSEEQQKIREEVHKAARNAAVKRIERKVSISMAKKARTEVELSKVEKRLRPAGPPMDRETITDEERHMYSKLGLKMHAFLLLGRRGIFDGTVENMHLHWKHRELVKVIYKARDKVDLEQTARMLEYESGGILVATIATSKGQAIIVYRGKNYQRPPELRPRTLLTKRQALKRSIEMQRQQALQKHILSLEKEISHMQDDLSKLSNEGDGISEENAESCFQEQDVEETAESTMYVAVKLSTEDEDSRDGGVEDSSKGGSTDAIFKADPLSRRERLVLRQHALKERKGAAHFNVGRSNVLSGLARAIRIHFRKHALVKIGVNGRAKGTPVEEIIFQLQDATGGTLVSREHSKIILYRGWPEGQERPAEGNGHWEELPSDLRNAMIAEAEADEDYLHESDWDESGDEDETEIDQDGDYALEVQDSLDSSGVDDSVSDWDEFDEDMEDTDALQIHDSLDNSEDNDSDLDEFDDDEDANDALQTLDSADSSEVGCNQSERDEVNGDEDGDYALQAYNILDSSKGGDSDSGQDGIDGKEDKDGNDIFQTHGLLGSSEVGGNVSDGQEHEGGNDLLEAHSLLDSSEVGDNVSNGDGVDGDEDEHCHDVLLARSRLDCSEVGDNILDGDGVDGDDDEDHHDCLQAHSLLDSSNVGDNISDGDGVDGDENEDRHDVLQAHSVLDTSEVGDNISDRDEDEDGSDVFQAHSLLDSSEDGGNVSDGDGVDGDEEDDGPDVLQVHSLLDSSEVGDNISDGDGVDGDEDGSDVFQAHGLLDSSKVGHNDSDQDKLDGDRNYVLQAHDVLDSSKVGDNDSGRDEVDGNENKDGSDVFQAHGLLDSSKVGDNDSDQDKLDGDGNYGLQADDVLDSSKVGDNDLGRDEVDRNENKDDNVFQAHILLDSSKVGDNDSDQDKLDGDGNYVLQADDVLDSSKVGDNDSGRDEVDGNENKDGNDFLQAHSLLDPSGVGDNDSDQDEVDCDGNSVLQAHNCLDSSKVGVNDSDRDEVDGNEDKDGNDFLQADRLLDTSEVGDNVSDGDGVDVDEDGTDVLQAHIRLESSGVGDNVSDRGGVDGNKDESHGLLDDPVVGDSKSDQDEVDGDDDEDRKDALQVHVILDSTDVGENDSVAYVDRDEDKNKDKSGFELEIGEDDDEVVEGKYYMFS